MGKKQKCPEFENHERWLVSYADMLTLLFAVFVVLFALKEGGQPETQKAAGSLQESFNTPLQDIPIDRRSGPTEQGFGVFEHLRGDQVIEPLIQKFPADEKLIPLIEDEMNRAKFELEDRLYGPDKFREEKGKTGQNRIVSVERTPKGFKIKLLARQFYDAGEVNIKKESLKYLDSVVGVLKELGRNIRIEGHTDSMPPKGMDNWDLSTLRATHVAKYFIREHGFPPTRISSTGYADTQPIAHNGTEAGRQLNRRIEIHISYGSADD